MPFTAITRQVSSSINGCELSFHARQPIDVERGAGSVMRDSRCGSRTEPGLPDAVFVEDAALVLDEIAVISNPPRRVRLMRTWEQRAGGPKRPV